MVSPSLVLQTENVIPKTDNHKALKFISDTSGTLQWSHQENLQVEDNSVSCKGCLSQYLRRVRTEQVFKLSDMEPWVNCQQRLKSPKMMAELNEGRKKEGILRKM